MDLGEGPGSLGGGGTMDILCRGVLPGLCQVLWIFYVGVCCQDFDTLTLYLILN